MYVRVIGALYLRTEYYFTKTLSSRFKFIISCSLQSTFAHQVVNSMHDCSLKVFMNNTDNWINLGKLSKRHCPFQPSLPRSYLILLLVRYLQIFFQHAKNWFLLVGDKLSDQRYFPFLANNLNQVHVGRISFFKTCFIGFEHLRRYRAMINQSYDIISYHLTCDIPLIVLD